MNSDGSTMATGQTRVLVPITKDHPVIRDHLADATGCLIAGMGCLTTIQF